MSLYKYLKENIPLTFNKYKVHVGGKRRIVFKVGGNLITNAILKVNFGTFWWFLNVILFFHEDFGHWTQTTLMRLLAFYVFVVCILNINEFLVDHCTYWNGISAWRNTGRSFINLVDIQEGSISEMSQGWGYSFYYFNFRSLVKNRSVFYQVGNCGEWIAYLNIVADAPES